MAHLLVRGGYEPNNVDDPWTLSFLYNFFARGIETDITFGNTFGSTGQSGVEHFGKIQALLYAPILSITDWNRNVAHTISLVLIIGALIAWYFSTLQISSNRSTALVFTLCLAITEPIIAASNTARPDALTFFLVSVAILAAIKRHPLLAGLTAALAIEVHPMGAMALLYVMAIYCANGRSDLAKKEIATIALKLALGFASGLAIYLLLHWPAALDTISVLSRSSGGAIGGSLLSYVFKSNYMRHVPEFVLFLLALVLFLWNKLYLRQPVIGWLLFFGAASLLIFQRSNHYYMLYYAPMFLLLWISVADFLKMRWKAVALLVVLMLSQYAVIAVRNSAFEVNEYVRELRAVVPSGSIPIVAEFNAWFAFYDREFYGNYYDDESYYFNRKEFTALNLSEFYLLDRLTPDGGASMGWRTKVLPASYACRELELFSLQGRSYGTYFCAKK